MAERASATSPRVLLRRLREVMAGPGSAQARLDTVVRIIAANMVAEVCSVYLMRPGEVLELFATEGLKPEAVHVTRMRVGEGLVGYIALSARPLSLQDAQSHPQFAYKPETGEEIYHSLMGVPVLRAGRVVGVLVVQNRTRRRYSEEEVEALETVAMVLAELIGSGQLVSREELLKLDGGTLLPQRIEGRTLAEGLALGTAVLREPRIEVAKTIAEDVGHEKLRLGQAVDSLRAAVDRMLAAPEIGLVGESREVLEAYKMFANDSGWLVRLQEAVESGLTAEAAVQRVQIDTRNRMQTVTDPYLRERLADLEDLAQRLLQHLAGRVGIPGEGLPDNAILFARAMGPAELLDYDRLKLRAVVLEEGSPTSHVAIVARALAVPVLGHCEGVLDRVEPGDQVIVDADHGQLFLRPGDDVLQAFRQTMAARAARQAKYAALRDEPATTRCGRRISLNINAGLLVDLQHLDETGADGIGLYRTELQFMVRATLPRVEVQTEFYTRVLDHAGQRPVVFRTLDIGGDKVLPYLGETGGEENPAMGWRAIRISLDRPALLRTQVRALLQAAAGRELNVMFPMVAEVAEFQKARDLMAREHERLCSIGRPVPRLVRIGTMLEVPSLAWQLSALLPLVDFVSVGSNDLCQFFFAADRGNARLADRYDVLSPSMLYFLHWLVRRCEAAGVPITLCGEIAGRPLEAMTLIGLGFRSISMPPLAIGPVKEMVRSLKLAPLASYLESLYTLPDHSVRGRLQSFAHDHGIVI